jgi:FkbM family methyltransferase
MSCSYFILSKEKEKDLTNNYDNTIICLNNKNVFILPYNNISYYTANGLFENSLIEWCKELCNKDKVMLDIGAHTGTYSIDLSRYCKTVYSFEPQKMTYYSLCGSVSLSSCHNIECINYGLGSPDQIGTKELNIISEDGGGSSIKPQDNAICKELIRVRTLDSFNISNIGFIKMDVEGNELDVLKGSLNTLRESNNPSILFESNETNIELFEFITNIGYKIININGYSNMFLAESINK